MEAKLPNSITKAGAHIYTSLEKLFPKLLPESDPDTSSLFYYPKYNRISIDIALLNCKGIGGEANYHLKGDINLPLGPFINRGEKEDFLNSYQKVGEMYRKKVELIKTGGV